MWHWDQGHLPYFQFETLRQMASFVVTHDFKRADRVTLLSETGLSFSGPITHNPWRNYSRALKLSLLISKNDDRAEATPVAHLLSQSGVVTCDEYFHFLVRATTEPSPALQDWKPNNNFRYPLLFAIKYILTKAAITESPFATFDEIIGAYKISNFVGDEDDNQFISIAGSEQKYELEGKRITEKLKRQPRESLKVIAQISYLTIKGTRIFVSLNKNDAANIFNELHAIEGPRASDGDEEIRRLATLFKDGSTDIFFDYPETILDEIEISGFREGSKVKRTHVTIERNSNLRRDFFAARPSSICDVCTLDTAKTYPWTKRVLDIHHLLPLSSGTRVEAHGTTFDDIVPVCPSCHRAIHRFYDGWLNKSNQKDFKDSNEAYRVYQEMKSNFPGIINAS